MRFWLKKTSISLPAVLSIAVSVVLTVLSGFPGASAGPVEEGQSLFKSKCSTCHAADGSGDTSIGKSMKIRDLRSPEVQKQSDAQLSAIIRDGRGKMPAMGKGLTDGQVHVLVAYIRELSGRGK